MPAGRVDFTVTNYSTAKVTEGEIQKDNRILGEKENITPGLSADFSLRLDPGTYMVTARGPRGHRAADRDRAGGQ